ncbi:F-box domain-containing protein [Mycena sanguinolenta]|uniref:F-box domain-containing protein n=1 Tax=Mycena sanguinolenta TaxID=230812 RepID=A0A8H7D9S1_9AGAR|nr:F-box domain-containing protein [Mycena sanguinolenta]
MKPRSRSGSRSPKLGCNVQGRAPCQSLWKATSTMAYLPPLTPNLAHNSPSPDLFLNLLVPHASRWQNIRLVIPSPALETLSALTERDVPLLKYFKLVQRPDQPHIDTKWALPRIFYGPNLSRISVLANNINPLDLPLRWSQLTAISFVHMGPAWSLGHSQTRQVILDILSRCPKLQSCKLLVQGPPEGDLPHSNIECPCLHTLELMCDGAPLLTAGSVLTHLSLPELRDFKLSGLGELLSVFAGESLVSSLAASVRLERISIHSNTFSKSSLHDFLRGLPSTIRYLHITEPLHIWRPSIVEVALDDEVFAALNATCCPALEELVINSCRKVSDEVLLRFILSRVATLKLVDIKFDREREVDILPHLEPFLEAGGKASITYITLIPPRFSPWMGLPDAPPPLVLPYQAPEF